MRATSDGHQDTTQRNCSSTRIFCRWGCRSCLRGFITGDTARRSCWKLAPPFMIPVESGMSETRSIRGRFPLVVLPKWPLRVEELYGRQPLSPIRRKPYRGLEVLVRQWPAGPQMYVNHAGPNLTVRVVDGPVGKRKREQLRRGLSWVKPEIHQRFPGIPLESLDYARALDTEWAMEESPEKGALLRIPELF